LATLAVAAVQLAAGVLEVTVAHVVAVQALAADATSGTQAATPIGPTLTGAGQVVVV